MRIRTVIAAVVVLLIIITIVLLRVPNGPATGNTLPNNTTPQIAFLSFKTGALAELYVYDQAADKIIKMTRTQNRVRSADWSPDGRYLAFLEEPQGENGIIYSLDVRTAEIIRLTPEDSQTCYNPVWSPSGSQIACSVPGSLPGAGEIFLLQADGSSYRFLTEGSAPSWSPDGVQLIYIAPPTNNLSEDNSQINSIDVETGEISIITSFQGLVDSPQFSPDKSMIAFLENHYGAIPGGVLDQSLKIWDGEASRSVAERLNYGTTFEWSSNGGDLRFLGCVYHVDTATTDCRSQTGVSYSPDGSQIAVVQDQSICLVPQPPENECKPLPAGITQLIGWRRS